MTSPLIRVVLQVWIIAFVAFLGAGPVLDDPGLRVLVQLLYALPLAAWAVIRLRDRWDSLDGVTLLALAAYAVVALLGRDKTGALGTVPLAAAFVAVFLLARREAASPIAEVVVRGAAIGLVLSLLLNAVLLLVEKWTWLSVIGSTPLEGRVVLPWGTVNALPVLVLLAVPFVAWIAPASLRRVLLVGLGLAAIVVVPLSLGRAGWLGLAVAAVSWLALRPATRDALSRVRIPPAVAVTGAVLVGVLLALVVIPIADSALAPTGRLALWDQAAAMVGDRPIAGSGPGAYSWARLDYGPQVAREIAVILPHSVPLQVLVDGGLVLGAGLAAAIGAWVVRISGRLAELTARDRVAVAALVGFAASALLDDFTFHPAVVVGVLVLAGLLVPAGPGEADRRGRLLLPILGVLALMGMPATIAVDQARAAAADARQAAADGRWADAVAGFRAATAVHPGLGGYWLGLGLAASRIGGEGEAADAYARAVRAAPGDPRGHAGRAAFASDDRRAEHLQLAAITSLRDPTPLTWLSRAYLEAGDEDSAAEAWARASSIEPALLRAWEGEATAEALAAMTLEAVERSPSVDPSDADASRWDIGLATDALPADAGMAWLAVRAAADGETSRAIELARATIDEAPHHPRSYQALAMVATFACEENLLAEALRKLEVAGGTWLTSLDSDAVRTEREFIYRQDGLWPSLPSAAPIVVPRSWPWGVVPDPEPCP